MDFHVNHSPNPQAIYEVLAQLPGFVESLASSASGLPKLLCLLPLRKLFAVAWLTGRYNIKQALASRVR